VFLPVSRQSDRDWQLFLDTALHDLRAQLRVIGLSAELLSEMSGDALNDDARQLARRLQDGVVRMTALLKALAEYSTALHIEDGSFGPVPTESVVRSALSGIAPMVRDTGASIDYTPLPSVHGNWEHLSTLFRNLLTNALQYRSATPPRVTISAKRDCDDWRFTVRDNGIGIDAQYQDLIFAPFQRLHGSDKPGAGLGLAACKRIVELHGGRIWVESAIGDGSAFFFTMPAAAANS
jgi:light-regulated signal transduction histidine kinase (bacteriophytochrome)